MDANTLKKLKLKIYLIFPFTFIFLAALLMLTAGTINYWQGWLYCLVILIPAFFVTNYFLKKSPEFLARRLKFKEKEAKQKKIIKIANIFFFLAFLISGFDYRFDWSEVPFWLIIFSNAAIIAGYFLVFLTFKENPFAARTVEVFNDQKVIDTGPYAKVRHPMYTGVLIMFLFTPLALGSYVALLFMLPVFIVIIVRTLNEEQVLKRDLAGYVNYCNKVHYRLLPFVW